jgi:hypothetical protein
VEALMKKERHDETQFITNFGGKNQFESQLVRFVKIFIPSYAFDNPVLTILGPLLRDFMDNSIGQF